ncbi:protein secretion protein [Lentibacillus lipolyticus]|nr:protein secretion protein [Lentibacillus lipolyticus]
MNRKLLWGIVAVLLVTNITTLLIWSQQKQIRINSGTAIDQSEPAAIIGEKEISYDEWIASLREEHGKQQLQTMIDKEVVRQLAEERDIHVSEKVIAREIALLTTTQGVMTEETTQQKEKQWRKDIQFRYRLEALLTDNVHIPENRVRTYYRKYQNQYDFQASIQLSHIVTPDMKTAEQVQKKLENGAEFRELARNYSIDEDTKQDGGYLGFFVNSSQFVPDVYVTAAAGMEERTYSEPIRRSDGVAIVFLHRKLPAIHFTYEEMKPYVKRELAMDELEQSLSATSLWREMEVEWVYEN